MQIITDSTYLEIEQIVSKYKAWMQVQRIGCSFEDRPIYGFRWGSGATKIMFWSTSNGLDKYSLNGLLAFIKLLEGKEPDMISLGTLIKWKSTFTFYFIPLLNPDGMINGSKVNAMGIDIYQDARTQIAPESQVLEAILNDYKPHYVIGLEGIAKLELSNTSIADKMLLLEIPTEENGSIINRSKCHSIDVNSMFASCYDVCAKLQSKVGFIHRAYDRHQFGTYIKSAGIPVVLIRAISHSSNIDETKLINLMEKTLICLLTDLLCIKKNNVDTSLVEAELVSTKAVTVDLLLKKAKITAKNGKRFVADIALNKATSGF